MDGRGVYFLFGSVFIKKSNQTKFFKKKNRNRTETSSNQPVSVRFGFLEQKLVQTGLARFFWFGSVFSFFSVLARFFSSFFWFRFGSVRFFRFQAEWVLSDCCTCRSFNKPDRSSHLVNPLGRPCWYNYRSGLELVDSDAIQTCHAFFNQLPNFAASFLCQRQLTSSG